MSSITALPASQQQQQHQHRPLAGKVALVTGGSRSIGAAIARRLAADGAAVALTYSASAEQAAAVVQAIEAAGGTALAIRADAADAAQVRAAVTQAVQTFGRLDILVNNAGIAIGKPVGDVTLDDFDRMIAVNVKGLFVATQEALRHLGDGGRIVNIGSINSEFVPYAGGSLYVMTKAAVAGLTKALARDLGSRGITINNVMPGPTDTDMNPAAGEFAVQARGHVALQRYAVPAEIADFVAYLASPGASYITGASLAADGGYSA
jgi:3-oxoacyl-[acyl-carrier protein] reductase